MENIVKLLCATTSSIVTVYILLETDVFYEYVRFLFPKLFTNYETVGSSDYLYSEYLSEYRDCFIVRLITCPVCLMAWTTTFFMIAYGFVWFNWWFLMLLPVGYYLSILGYYKINDRPG